VYNPKGFGSDAEEEGFALKRLEKSVGAGFDPTVVSGFEDPGISGF
jgi:Asp/Glu/hydantoin racemase